MSTGVFNGGIDVCPGADGTDAEQSNDNLLLSNRAEVNTQPRLEILADEVACKHGATVGQLDDTALYYLRSRGIGADEARRLLINGFADEVVDDVGIETVRAGSPIDWDTTMTESRSGAHQPPGVGVGVGVRKGSCCPATVRSRSSPPVTGRPCRG
jgi:hypothetical protein